MKARFGHLNVIAKDWRALSDFYQRVFGCVPVPPQRDYRSADLDRGTGLRNAHRMGEQLRLPGLGPQGPTLEIYNFEELEPRPSRAIHRPGFAHIAFAVDDVAAAREEVLREGGSAVGEVVTLQTATG